MKILAFDTTLGACSVAVWADGTVQAAAFRLQQQGHAEALFPMIDMVRAEAGIALADLDAVALTIGPGTFTGVRIGLAAARGLRLALRRPVVPVPTLQAVAAAARRGAEAASVLTVHDARRGEVYVQPFAADLHPLADPAVEPLETVADRWQGQDVLLAGTGAPALAALWPAAVRIAGDPLAPGFGQPDAREVAALAADALRHRGADAFVEPPRPVYLRAPDAKLPAPRPA